jgi:hypothetical protein
LLALTPVNPAIKKGSEVEDADFVMARKERLGVLTLELSENSKVFQSDRKKFAVFAQQHETSISLLGKVHDSTCETTFEDSFYFEGRVDSCTCHAFLSLSVLPGAGVKLIRTNIERLTLELLERIQCSLFPV